MLIASVGGMGRIDTICLALVCAGVWMTLVAGQVEDREGNLVEGISYTAIPSEATPRSYVIVATDVEFIGRVFDQTVAAASETCLTNVNVAEVRLAAAYLPLQAMDVTSIMYPYTLVFWSNVEPPRFITYRETFYTYVRNGSFVACLEEALEGDEQLFSNILSEPRNVTTVDETATIPFWVFMVIAAALSVLLLAIVLVIFCLKSLKQTHTEDEYVAEVGLGTEETSAMTKGE